MDDCLLVYAANGEPLRPAHGYPVRLLVPGWPGSLSQKWLTRVTLLAQPHRGQGMGGTSYRLPHCVGQHHSPRSVHLRVHLRSWRGGGHKKRTTDATRVGCAQWPSRSTWCPAQATAYVEPAQYRGIFAVLQPPEASAFCLRATGSGRLQ
jgi:DMSO/TMAO reductase YedYZ molybdopterin-dependent catalytic subunit